MEPQYGVGQCPCQMRAWIAAQEGQHTPSLKKPDTLLSDKYVAISNIVGYCDKILYACSPQDNRSVEAGHLIERHRRRHIQYRGIFRRILRQNTVHLCTAQQPADGHPEDAERPWSPSME